MPKIHIARSIGIHAPMVKIYELLGDFTHWPPWSPWLIMEEGVEIEYASDGKSYTWQGNRVGAGKMSIYKENGTNRIDYNLQFLKPIKSKAIVAFELKENGSTTEVTWMMDTSLPFFMFWMTRQMIAFMNADYDRGLMMLREYAEKGEVHSSMDPEGIVTYKGCEYVGVTTECSVEEMPAHMSQDFKALSLWVDDEELDVNGEPFTIYHKMDRVKNQAAFTVGIPINEFPDTLPSPYHEGKIPSLRAFRITHEGPYHYLGNPWTLGNMMARNKEIKLRKGFPPFEIYLNDPQDTADELLETAIYFPVEG